MNVIQRMIKRIGRMVQLTLWIGLVVAGCTLGALYKWCYVYVPSDKCLVWIAKSGKPMPPSRKIAEPGEKGIQRATSGPGRYFYNPINWDNELCELTVIKPGNPESWKWVHTTRRMSKKADGGNILDGDFPEVGILVRRTGDPAPDGTPVVEFDSNYQGYVRQVLTPGIYRINPYEFEVRKEPAVVVPAGFVGVLTNQIGTQPRMIEVPDVEAGDVTGSAPAKTKKIRPLALAGERGTLRDVLPPGVYYLNPNVERVKIVEVGFNEFSQVALKGSQETIRFPSKSGFDIELGVTVVWGLHPQHAAEVINEFGNTTEVLEKVIKPQLRSICRNEGSLYEARDFIQGERREQFQQVLTQTLRDVCRQKNIELLLALISTIEVFSREGQAAAGEIDLQTEIQDSFIAIERQLTNIKLQETAKKKALLEEAKKKVDVTRETIQAQTRKKVAEILADGQRAAAEIEAQGKLQVATIEQQIAAIEAEKVELLGRAEADVARLKQQAEADGKRILVEALGSGEAYNLYTFARNFEPESIRLFFAGEGTFWTDLRNIEEMGAMQIMRETAGKKTSPAGNP